MDNTTTIILDHRRVRRTDICHTRRTGLEKATSNSYLGRIPLPNWERQASADDRLKRASSPIEDRTFLNPDRVRPPPARTASQTRKALRTPSCRPRSTQKPVADAGQSVERDDLYSLDRALDKLASPFRVGVTSKAPKPERPRMTGR